MQLRQGAQQGALDVEGREREQDIVIGEIDQLVETAALLGRAEALARSRGEDPVERLVELFVVAASLESALAVEAQGPEESTGRARVGGQEPHPPQPPPQPPPQLEQLEQEEPQLEQLEQDEPQLEKKTVEPPQPPPQPPPQEDQPPP